MEAGREELTEEDVSDRRAEARGGCSEGELRRFLLVVSVDGSDDLNDRAPSDRIRERVEPPREAEDVDGLRVDGGKGGEDPDAEDADEHGPAAEPVSERSAEQLAGEADDRDKGQLRSDLVLELSAHHGVGEDGGLDGRDHHTPHLVDQHRGEEQP